MGPRRGVAAGRRDLMGGVTTQQGIRILTDRARTAAVAAPAGLGMPVGVIAVHPKSIQALVDEHWARYEGVWAAAGPPRSVLPTTSESPFTLTGGTAANVAEHKDDFVS